MANPFLVLGGIAVAVIVSAVGIVNVPGWVDAAHDAAAIHDLSAVTDVQAAANSMGGQAQSSMEDLVRWAREHGMTMTASEGPDTMTSSNEHAFGVISVSQTGRAYGQVNGGLKYQGASMSDLIRNEAFACEWVDAGLSDIGVVC